MATLVPCLPQKPEPQPEALGCDEENKHCIPRSIEKKRSHARNWLLKLLRKHPNPATPERLRDKALVVAPMVDQSDLPFRLLCRQYGANLAFTPMIHARLFQDNPGYRQKFFDLVHGTPPQDRPLIAQLCGGAQPDLLLRTAQDLQPFVDGIDLNCGCPQGIAKRGQYGAFLLEEPDVLLPAVKLLCENLTVPVSVKVRLLPQESRDSLALYQKLVEECGVSMLTVHGRNRHQKGPLTGAADWDMIRQTVQLLGHRVPIIANGSISSLADVEECLRYTGADGIMSSEAVLEYPPVFCQQDGGRTVGRLELAQQYMELARTYPPERGGQGSGLKCMRIHLHRFLHADLQERPNFRDMVVTAWTKDALQEALDVLATFHSENNHVVSDEALSWYMRHRKGNDHHDDEYEHDDNEQDNVVDINRKEHEIAYKELSDDNADCMACLFDDDVY